MADDRTVIKRTVYYDAQTGSLCTCQGEFWKVCPLRVANRLPCQEAIISITPVERDKNDDPASDVVRSLDPAFKNLSHSIKSLQKHLKP